MVKMMALFDFAQAASRHHSDVTSSDGHSGALGASVDVVPFVTSVVNTYASWRAEFAAEVCPTAAS